MCNGCLVLPGNLRARVRMIWLGSGLVVKVRVKIRIRVWAHHGLCWVVSSWVVQNPCLEHNILYIQQSDHQSSSTTLE